MASGSETTARVILELQDRASAPTAEVTGQVRQLREEAPQAARATRQVADEAERGGGALDRFGEGAGKAEGSLNAVRGAVGLVSPELAGMLGNVTDLLGAVDGVSGAVSSMGLSFSAVAGPLAIVTGAVIGLYMAYDKLADAEKKVEDRNASITAHADEVAAAHRKVTDARTELKLATGELTQEQVDNQAADQAAKEMLEEGTRALLDRKKALEAEAAALKDAIGARTNNATAGGLLLGLALNADDERRLAEIGQELDGVNTQYAQAQVMAAGYGETLRGLARAKRDTADATDAEAEAERRLAEARARAAAMAGLKGTATTITAADAGPEYAAIASTVQQLEALKQQAAELGPEAQAIAAPAIQVLEQRIRSLHQAIADKEFQASVDQVGEMFAAIPQPEATAWMAEFTAQLEAIAPPEQLQPLDALVALELELEAAYRAGTLSAEQYAAAVEQLAAARGRASTMGAEDPAAAMTAEDGAAMAASGLAGIAGGASGILGTIGSMGGPYGAAIAAGIQAVMALGATDEKGRATYAREIGDFLAELAASLPRVAETLVEVLVVVLRDTLPDIITGLGEGVNAILTEAVPAVLDVLLDPQVWMDLGVALAKAYAQYLLGLAEMVVRSVGMVLDTVVDGVSMLFRAETWQTIGHWIGGAIKEILTGWASKDGKIAQAWDWTKQQAQTVGSWFAGAFASGTSYVSRTGGAVVHEGEVIVPTSGTTSSAARSRMGGVSRGGITIVMPEGLLIGTVDELVRRLEEVLGPDGRRLTLGGA